MVGGGRPLTSHEGRSSVLGNKPVANAYNKSSENAGDPRNSAGFFFILLLLYFVDTRESRSETRQSRVYGWKRMEIMSVKSSQI